MLWYDASEASAGVPYSFHDVEEVFYSFSKNISGETRTKTSGHFTQAAWFDQSRSIADSMRQKK
jgi:hypothetical protein